MTADTKKQEEKRIDYLDALRTVACFAVVMLHVAASETYHVEFHSHEWNVFMLYESVVNWAVPVFVMISGAAMLKKDYSYSTMIPKILKIVRVFIIWSVLFLISDMLINADIDYRANALWFQVLLQGHYHMWYLIMLCGLYLITPLVKAVVDKPVLLKAFLYLSLAFTFVAPSIKALPQLNGIQFLLQKPIVGALFRAFCNIEEDTTFYLTLGFTAYFAFGYALAHHVIIHGKKSVIGMLFLFVGTIIVFSETRMALSKESAGTFLKYNQIGIFLQASGLLMALQYLSGTKVTKLLAKHSKATFLIYLIHPLIIEGFQKNGVSSLLFNPFFSVPLLSIVVFSCSLLLARIIMLTPLNRILNI